MKLIVKVMVIVERMLYLKLVGPNSMKVLVLVFSEFFFFKVISSLVVNRGAFHCWCSIQNANRQCDTTRTQRTLESRQVVLCS